MGDAPLQKIQVGPKPDQIRCDGRSNGMREAVPEPNRLTLKQPTALELADKPFPLMLKVARRSGIIFL